VVVDVPQLRVFGEHDATVEEAIHRIEAGRVIGLGQAREHRLQRPYTLHGLRPDTLRGLGHAVEVPGPWRQRREHERARQQQGPPESQAVGRIGSHGLVGSLRRHLGTPGWPLLFRIAPVFVLGHAGLEGCIGKAA
jgi:hypothetical protein